MSHDHLGDAAELLIMLERLIGELAKNGPHDGIPWRGIQLTLEQARRAVKRAAKDMRGEEGAAEDIVSAALKSSPLAKRLRPSPLARRNGEAAASAR